MEPGMIFMPCDAHEELPGHRPMLYGITPNEDLVMFKETTYLSPAPLRPHQKQQQRFGAASIGGKKQVTWANDRSAQESSGQMPSSGRFHEIQESTEAADVCSQPHHLRQGVLDASTSIKQEGWTSVGAPSAAAEDLNSRQWVAAAETDHLMPILVFTIRDMSGGSCTLAPGNVSACIQKFASQSWHGFPTRYYMQNAFKKV
jgi:hypothetical protein